MSLATVVQRLLSSASESWRSWKTTRCSTLCAESRSGALPSFSARTPRWTSIVASPPSSRIMFAPDSPGHWRICWAHHQYSSRDSPFQANTGTPCGSSTVPFGPTTTAAAAWSCVEKMLQLAQRTSAPRAVSVSISTAVWIVMCSDPVMRAPARGCCAANSSRVDIRPGISCSARVISLRPKSARERSATLKSAAVAVGVLVVVVIDLRGLVARPRLAERVFEVLDCGHRGRVDVPQCSDVDGNEVPQQDARQQSLDRRPPARHHMLDVGRAAARDLGRQLHAAAFAVVQVDVLEEDRRQGRELARGVPRADLVVVGLRQLREERRQ